MPTVLRTGGFEFAIHINDHPPAHVHAYNADGECRIVIEPDVVLDTFWNMKEVDARQAVRLASRHEPYLRSEWERIHGLRE
ncbi:MAG: DUF4160 domain-containing protein [Gemmatimonadetes bacterium]|nr:DUF4160 domain-containing protein [Gemmatimonadota bacterium]